MGGVRGLEEPPIYSKGYPQPAKSPVGEAPSASMPFLRSFGFWRFEIERDVAPRGLGKASLRDKEDDWGGFPGALLLANFQCPVGTFGGPGSTGSLSERGLSNFSL